MKKCTELPEIGQWILVKCAGDMSIAQAVALRPQNKSRRFQAKCICHWSADWWTNQWLFDEDDNKAELLEAALDRWKRISTAFSDAPDDAQWRFQTIKPNILYTPTIIAELKVQGLL